METCCKRAIAKNAKFLSSVLSAPLFCEPHYNFGESTEIAAERRDTPPPDRPLFAEPNACPTNKIQLSCRNWYLFYDVATHL